jgi:sulfoxide reductase heme-binding subunit YedZ
MLAAWLKNHFDAVWHSVFFASAMPGAYLAYLFQTDDLGSNPLATLMQNTGRASLVMLSITLLVTPLRRWLSNLSKLTHRRYGKRLADWNWLIRLRRQLGLWCFFYALLHAGIYVNFDMALDWQQGLRDTREKPYIVAGLAGLLMLIPLALTSTQRMIRQLGRNWRRLHTLTYGVAIAGLLHFWWMMKPGLWTPWPDTLVILILLGYRVLLRTGILARWDGFDGQESSERAALQQQARETTEGKTS